ncbi:hypothetical protein [Mesorhizobium loti]|uniref:hypothetical protein n=1 Tax=Rhizobium loti TaxID=381 RepID=UPI001269874E|nr:hypothetical protein [Mesorhizobium loti]
MLFRQISNDAIYPDDLEMLQRVLNTHCTAGGFGLTSDMADAAAFKLILWFRAGITDDESLGNLLAREPEQFRKAS